MSDTVTFTFEHDTEMEGRCKLPRRGMWNRFNGSLTVRCPVCGNVTTVDGHRKHGELLDPSVGCPHHGCSFHSQPTYLTGYKDG